MSTISEMQAQLDATDRQMAIMQRQILQNMKEYQQKLAQQKEQESRPLPTLPPPSSVQVLPNPKKPAVPRPTRGVQVYVDDVVFHATRKGLAFCIVKEVKVVDNTWKFRGIDLNDDDACLPSFSPSNLSPWRTTHGPQAWQFHDGMTSHVHTYLLVQKEGGRISNLFDFVKRHVTEEADIQPLFHSLFQVCDTDGARGAVLRSSDRVMSLLHSDPFRSARSDCTDQSAWYAQRIGMDVSYFNLSLNWFAWTNGCCSSQKKADWTDIRRFAHQLYEGVDEAEAVYVEEDKKARQEEEVTDNVRKLMDDLVAILEKEPDPDDVDVDDLFGDEEAEEAEESAEPVDEEMCVSSSPPLAEEEIVQKQPSSEGEGEGGGDGDSASDTMTKDTWECKVCTFANRKYAAKCTMCKKGSRPCGILKRKRGRK